MAKKFVRGVTGVDDIDKFDTSLTNVNDIISDGQNTYVHTKKGKNELYYNITNAINKVQSSDNTLTITKENDTVSIANKTLATKQELSQKQDKLNSSMSIAVTNGQWLRQAYFKPYTYNSSNGLLKTRVKSIVNNTTPDNAEEEFNFTVKINQKAQNVVFTLSNDDKTSFSKIMSKYGSNNTVRISGCVLTLSGSNLTVSTTENTAQNYVMTFSDIV